MLNIMNHSWWSYLHKLYHLRGPTYSMGILWCLREKPAGEAHEIWDLHRPGIECIGFKTFGIA